MEENPKLRSKSLLRNMIYAFSVQGVSLILSIMMSLIVPKILGVEAYSYWQLFLFYTGYVGFFQFGFIDGIYLRYGGKRYNELDFSTLSCEFWVSLLFQIILAVGGGIYAVFFVTDAAHRFVLYLTIAYMVIGNVAGMLGYVFQATNRVNLYSTSVLVDKSFFILAVIFLLFFRTSRFEVFVWMYLIGKTLTLLYSIVCGYKVVFAKPAPLMPSLREVGRNVSAGVNLMLSNIASMLILGVGRFFVVRLWGMEAFGKFSFSITLTNFFLLFIAQASMVLFPALRQTNEKQLKQLYCLGRDLLNIALAGIYLCYVPMKLFLGKWLPQYNEALTYLILLLPLCVFDGKMNLLCTTYMKVLRQERVLLAINALSFAASFVLCFFGGYILHDINAIIIFMVISVALRSIISEIYLSKQMAIPVGKGILLQGIFAGVFVICTWFVSPILGFFIYATIYFGYLLVTRKNVKRIFSDAHHIFSK